MFIARLVSRQPSSWPLTNAIFKSPRQSEANLIIAIQMRNVYEQAERVLVLDSELMASAAAVSYEELNMRVLCTRWIRRLLTVQEAVLAKRLIFQFAERSHMIQNKSLLWYARARDLKFNSYNSIGIDCLIDFKGHEHLDSKNLVLYLWKILLAHRSVSVQADEPICGAILLNFDMERLMKVSESERMREFWRLQNEGVPISILYVPGPRLKDKGFSWAPATLLSCQSAGVDLYDHCRVTDDGLCLKLPPYTSFKLSILCQVRESRFPCTLDGSRHFFKKSPVKSNPSWDGLDLHKREDLATLIEMPPVQGRDKRRSVPDLEQPWYPLSIVAMVFSLPNT
jgi:hypothetical protein